MLFLTTQPIDVAEVAESVHANSRGAIVTFAGTVRDHDEGERVLTLEYSAYGAMAEETCATIVSEASGRWAIGVALRHRIGALAIGDVAICVAVAAAHREEAFAACAWIVDEVKRRAPIWKHECFADGRSIWVDPSRTGRLTVEG